MRTLSLTILFSLLLSAATVFAGDILVLQSMRVKPFDDALRGFRSVCKAGTKTVVVTDAEGSDIPRMVREQHPQLILAIGAEALKKVKKIREIPIVYLMVLNPKKIIGGSKNIAGVDMNIPPGKYLSLMERLNRSKLRIGLLYDPANTEAFVQRIRQTAKARGIEVTAREVRHPQEVPELLSEMKSSCNFIWMIPDATVVTPDTVEFLLRFSQQNGTPVVTFAGKYVDAGALVSLDIDVLDLGKEAGEIANKILDGTRVSEIPDIEARKAVLKVNRKVATKLGINLNGIEDF